MLNLNQILNKLQAEMIVLEKSLEESKKIINENTIKIKHYENVIIQKDQKIHKITNEFQVERESDSKIVTEYINAENYLLELVDEFTHGMKKIYSNDIDFKDVDIDDLPFCERFSNLLYNILLIIDFQKQFIMEQSNNQINQNPYNNECIIEEAENEEETENEGQNFQKHSELDNDTDEDNMSRINDKEILLNHVQQNENMRYHKQPDSIKGSSFHDHQFSSDARNDNDNNYDSRQSSDLLSDRIAKQSSDNDLYDSNGLQQEPSINKAKVTIQKELHKSLFSQNMLKINESPKISLLTDRSQKSSRYKTTSDGLDKTNDGSNTNLTAKANQNAYNPFHQDIVPNIFGLNARPSSCEVVSPTSESSRRSIRKDHLSKENRYQMEYCGLSEGNSEEWMSLESIVINKSGNHKHKASNSESAEEAFTPNFITKRSSWVNNLNNNEGKMDSAVFYKNNSKEIVPYDYRPPLVSGLYSEGNQFNEDQFEEEFSESMEGSEHMFSSNREDVEEFKTDLVFPKVSPKTN